MRRGLGIVVVVAMAIMATAARADSVQERAAALFDEGQRLIEAGKIAEACEKFDASLAVEPALGTKLNLADCHERQGKLVAAYRLFEQVELEAVQAGADKVNQARVVLARERIALLSHKLVRVTLRVGDPGLAGLTIVLNRRDLPRDAWSTPQLVEPGEVVVEASAPGHQPAQSARKVAADDTIILDVPVLASTQRPEVRHRSKLPAYISAGTGTALLAGSIILGVHAKAKYDHALTELRPDIDAQIDDAQFQGNVATGLAVAGAVGVALGVVLYVRASFPVIVVPAADNGAVGLAAAGRF